MIEITTQDLQKALSYATVHAKGMNIKMETVDDRHITISFFDKLDKHVEIKIYSIYREGLASKPPGITRSETLTDEVIRKG